MIYGERAPYGVTARYLGRSADGVFAEECTQEPWRLAQHLLDRSVYTPDAAGIIAAGSRLFRALMQGQVRDLWISARADLEQERVDGLRLRLALQPPMVAALPWESLYDPDRNLAFAANPQTPLVRVEPRYAYVGPPRRLHVTLPLRVLIVAPDDPHGVLATDKEIEGITQALQGVGEQFLSIQVLRGRFGVTELRRRLQESRADVLHYIGHGTPDGLLLWQRNQPALAPAASLRATLNRVRSVKLAFLNSCLAGRGIGLAPINSVAGHLLQAGLPAVIAMQAEIRDDAAIDFAHFVYEELVAGPCPGQIDIAVAAARSSLYALNPGDFSYGTPLLWLNGEDGRVFTLTETPAASGTGAATEPPSPELLADPDLDAEREWLEQVAQTDLSRLPPDYAFVRAKWLHLLAELGNLLHQLAALRAQREDETFAAKLTEYRRYKAALLRLRRLIAEVTAA
ncbi:MAG TPA: CHAT domain-containing protein [Caldilineaceae bacterium]|nr:CHAT domain-containing protein [Caldilineaceae bacterium]